MMKKIISVAFVSVLFLINMFAQTKITDERAILLLNYLQYSFQQVTKNPNQIVAEHEFNQIINRINTTTLKEQKIIDIYDEILDDFDKIKIANQKKTEAEAIAQLERQQALINSVSGVNPQFFIGDPTAILLNIGFSALNAGLNYSRSISQTNIDLIKTVYEINGIITEKLGKASRELYSKSAEVFSDRPDSYALITPEKMQDFIKIVNSESSNEIQENLLDIKKTFRYFPLYWFALGYAQQINGNIKDALDSYEKYETLISKEPILSFDEIYTQLLLAKIDIYKVLEGNNSANITKCIESLQKQFFDAPLEQQTQIMYVLGLAYLRINEYDNALLCVEKIFRKNTGNWSETASVLKDIIEQEKNGGFEKINVNLTTIEKPIVFEDNFNNIVENEEKKEEKTILGFKISRVILFSIISVVLFLRGYILKLLLIVLDVIKNSVKKFLILVHLLDDDTPNFIEPEVLKKPPHLYLCTFCGDNRKGWKKPHASYPCPNRRKGNSCHWIRVY